ncbi:hypothetical protein V8G54_008182 [Vigna mungo]|uniref:Uncharacterized protein n=1 Tax=Vigna mungo TaxID=3915 RepID=A0AAQ3P4P4_VIGMU
MRKEAAIKYTNYIKTSSFWIDSDTSSETSFQESVRVLMLLLRRLLSSEPKRFVSGLLGSSFSFSSFSSISVSSLLEVVLEPHDERSTGFLPFILSESGFSEIAWFISSLVAFGAVFTLVSPFSSDSDEETAGDLEAEC